MMLSHVTAEQIALYIKSHLVTLQGNSDWYISLYVLYRTWPQIVFQEAGGSK
jgi:hypothetical protein